MQSEEWRFMFSALSTLRSVIEGFTCTKNTSFDIDGTLSTGLTTMMPESAVKVLAQLRANGHFTPLRPDGCRHLQPSLPRATASRTL